MLDGCIGQQHPDYISNKMKEKDKADKGGRSINVPGSHGRQGLPQAAPNVEQHCDRNVAPLMLTSHLPFTISLQHVPLTVSVECK